VALVEALFAWALAGGGHYYTGSKLHELGYPEFAWTCWIAAGALTLNVLVRAVLAAMAGKGAGTGEPSPTRRAGS
jgi:hypothetical protein